MIIKHLENVICVWLGYMGNSRKLRLLRLLRVGLRLRVKFGKKRAGRRPFPSNKLSVSFDIGLILHGL